MATLRKLGFLRSQRTNLKYLYWVYVALVLSPAVEGLRPLRERAPSWGDETELNGSLRDYVGQETPLYFAERLTEHYKRANGEGPHIYLKKEDLNHTEAHGLKSSVNNFVTPVEEWTVNGTALTMSNKTRC